LTRSTFRESADMSTNSEVAKIFYAMADLLDLQGERFKPDAYRRAARSIESLGEDLRKVAQRGGLDQIPGVGEALREKIIEYLRDGKVSAYEKLRATFPPGVLELMRIPGIGPKTTGRFYLELHLDSPAALTQAIEEGRLNGLTGFGPRKIENLREALRAVAAAPPSSRTPLLTAWRLARSVMSELSRRTPVHDIAVAGSVRRCRENAGDLDILATSAKPPDTIAVFAGLASVRKVVMQGDTRATVIHEPGIQIDLRVVDPGSYGAALQYFTGSKDHNIHVRSLARDHGFKINEYGVFRGEERVAGATEVEVYDVLGLQWMPPEIRENQGEIELAQQRKVPTLVGIDQIRGELHRHVPKEPDVEWMKRLVADARRQKLQYLGLVVPAEGRSDSHRALVAELRRWWTDAGAGGLRLQVGGEIILGTAADPADPESLFDYLIGVPGEGGGPSPPKPPAGRPSRRPVFVGHLPLAPPGGDVPRDVAAPWIEWCRTNGVALEITPAGAENGLDAGAARWAHEAGVPLVLSGGLEELSELELTVARARRGWVPAEGVLNARAGGVGGAGSTESKPKRPARAARK
jgi:DNA polymerase/3'-5' exonuclease PolX